MTEDVKDAPSVDATEPLEQPAPAMPSEGSPKEGSAQPGPDVSAIVEAKVKAAISSLDATLDDKVDARFKSGKDRRFALVGGLNLCKQCCICTGMHYFVV